MAVFLFVFVIHLSFMMSGRTYLVQDAYALAFRASMLPEKEDAAGFVAGAAGTQTGHKYFGQTKPETEVSADGKYIVVRLKNKTNRKAFDLAPQADWETKGGARAIRVDITKRIRRIDRLADMAAMALQKAGATDGQGN